MVFQSYSLVRATSAKSSLALRIALLIVIVCSDIGVALARDEVRLVNLGTDRHLLIRISREGVILHFMGKHSSPDDNVVLLPNKWYVADVSWLAGAATVVVATGISEIPVDVYGFDRSGRRCFRRRTRQEECVRLQPLPGDSLVVVSNCNLAKPPEVMHARKGEWLDGYLSWPWDRRDFLGRPVYRRGDLHVLERGFVVMIDRSEEGPLISVQDIGAEAPLWEGHTLTGISLSKVELDGIAVLDTTLLKLAAEDTTRHRIAASSILGFQEGSVNERGIVLAGGIGGGRIALVSFNRESGEILASTLLPGQTVKLLLEPGGNRLLAIIKDRKDRGHLLILDRTTLELQTVIANPGGWYVQPYWTPPALSAPGESLSLVPDRIGGPGSSVAVPRSLVVTWDDEVGVHWLDAPAALADDGGVSIAHRYRREGGVKAIRIEEWRRPGNPATSKRRGP